MGKMYETPIIEIEKFVFHRNQVTTSWGHGQWDDELDLTAEEKLELEAGYKLF